MFYQAPNWTVRTLHTTNWNYSDTLNVVADYRHYEVVVFFDMIYRFLSQAECIGYQHGLFVIEKQHNPLLLSVRLHLMVSQHTNEELNSS